MMSASALSHAISDVTVMRRHVQVGGCHGDGVRSNRVVDYALVKPGVIASH